MEKKTRFANQSNRMSDLEIGTSDEQGIISKAKSLIEEGKNTEAFIVLCYHRDLMGAERLSLIEDLTGCKINTKRAKEIHAYKESDFFNKIENEPYFFSTYEDMITLYVLDKGVESTIVFLLAHKRMWPINDQQLQFVEKVIAVKARKSSWQWVAWDAMYRFCLRTKDEKRTDCLVALTSKLLEYGCRNLLLSFYWYYLYLGEREIAEIIFSTCFSSLENEGQKDIFQIPFVREDVAWAVDTAETFEKRYKKIIANDVQRLVERGSLTTFVPMCLYCQGKNNSQTESLILWWLVQKVNSKVLFNRMAAISGFEVPPNLEIMLFKDRPIWLAKRLEDCRKALTIDYRHPALIKSCKEAYTIKPFDRDVLYGLFKQGSFSSDTEIEAMIKHSVAKTTSANVLSSLLCRAMKTKNEYAVKVVLERILFLEYHDTILRAVEKIQKDLVALQTKECELTVRSLEFYSEFVPTEEKDLNRLSLLQKKLNLLGTFKTATTEVEKLRIAEERKAAKLLHYGEYKSLCEWLDQGNIKSLAILAAMLRSAISIGSTKHVLLAYRKLSEMDSAAASFYNVEVEPFFLKQRITKSKTANTGLISGVWAKPAILENPVNNLGRRITNFGK